MFSNILLMRTNTDLSVGIILYVFLQPFHNSLCVSTLGLHLFLPWFQSLLFCSLPCCFSLTICSLASHSAAVRAFSLSSSSLPFCFVPVSFSLAAAASLYPAMPFALLLLLVSLPFTLSLCRCPFLLLGFQLFAVFFCPSPGLFPGFCAFFLPFLPLFLFFPSFFFSQTSNNQHFCTHSVRAIPNNLTSRSLLPIWDNHLITNYICPNNTRFCSLFKRYFCFSLLFASFLFS